MTSLVRLLQAELEAESATLVCDPYMGGTFREKYFTPNNKIDDRQRRVVKTTDAGDSTATAGMCIDDRTDVLSSSVADT